MIKAAIVGLGWWGKTLVESVQDGSDAIRFVAGATRTVTPDGRGGVRRRAGSQARRRRTRRCWPIPASTRSCSRRRISQHASRSIAAAAAGKHVFCEKPFALTKADAEAAVEAMRRAGVTLGLGYNRRFHPEMTKLRERIRSGELGDDPARRSDDDVPERALAQAEPVARPARRDAVRRADADGRARRRRHDRPLRPDRPGVLPELPPRRRDRRRRHDVDAVPDEGRACPATSAR